MIAYSRAYYRTNQGWTTGPASRLLSWITLNLYVVFAVMLLENKLYLPLIIAVVLFFAPLGSLGTLALAVYLAYIHFWTGLSLILVCLVLGFASFMFGVRYNKKLIKARGALIDPFETMPEIGAAIIVQLVALGGALLLPGVLAILLWVVYILATAFLAWRFAFRLRSPWARIHYPLMLRYSALAGVEAAAAATYGRDYSMNNVLLPLLRSLYPDREDHELQDVISSAERKLTDFSDEAPLREFLNPLAGATQTDAILARTKADIQDRVGWDAKLLRFVIAEVVTREFGHKERTKYIAALLTGDAL